MRSALAALLLLAPLSACSPEPAGGEAEQVTLEQFEREAFGPVEEPLFAEAGAECLGIDAPVALRLLGAQGGEARLQESDAEPACELVNAQRQVVATLMRLPPGATPPQALLSAPGQVLATEAGGAASSVTLHLAGWAEGPAGEGLLAGPEGYVLVRFQSVGREQAEQFLRLQGVRALTAPADPE